MLCHNSNNHSASNSYMRKNCCSDFNGKSNLLSSSTASTLTPKQRSSIYKKYRRAKSLESGYNNCNTGNDNNTQYKTRNNNNCINASPPSTNRPCVTESAFSSFLTTTLQRIHARLANKSGLYSCTSASSSFGLTSAGTFRLWLCMLLLLRLASVVSGVAVGVDTTNVNVTDLGSPAPKYQTAYACEGKKLTIECDPGDLINLIRANYGRFSITICNDHGNVEWSVNCMFPKSLTVLNSKCSHKQSCSVLATTSMFGDPCPGTHKYLEAHYQCISAAQTSTTTNRPSPPWVLANNPPLLANGSTLINPSAPLQPQVSGRLPLPAGVGMPGSSGGLSGNIWHTLPPAPGPPLPTLPGGRLKGSHNATALKNANRHDGLPPPPSLHHHHHGGHNAPSPVEVANAAGASTSNTHTTTKGDAATSTPNTNQSPSNTTASPNTRILSGVGGSGTDDGTLLTSKTAQNRGSQQQQSTPTQQHASGVSKGNHVIGAAADTTSDGTNGIRTINNINNLNIGLGAAVESESNMYCGPTNARNLFWNITRVGDVNVQPCPGGATGIAKWRCVLKKRDPFAMDDAGVAESTTTMRTSVRSDCSGNKNSSCETTNDKLNQRIGNFVPFWHPLTPDLTQCRSLWLNSLEVRVNQRESSVISIANDLSEVTSSKILYGGDMLVTTKIIQTMSEKMFHDKETLPDQRQREAIILELLHGVVKTGSNLLDESQLPSWMDLNQEDQMRVATSLLTGLEYNAFLLADTIIREQNVVQKVRNILLSVRVLESKNIQSNEVFPDPDQWKISDDRIELPRTALLENSEGGLVRIVFAAFDRLESILKPSYDYFDTKSSRSYVRNTAVLSSERNESAMAADAQQRIRILNSKVISASLGKGRHIQLSQPIKLVLRHIKTENVTNPTCVFWNYIDHAWSANGCTLESTNRTHSICMCNHLTNFAILMDVMDEHSHSLFGVFNGNMRILIYISISICLVFVVIALLTLKIFNGVFIKSARTSIYRSIYICLLFVEILFLIGIEQNETSILCGFTTVFLHCSILAAISWFCFEAFQSYSTLTTDDMLLEVDQTSKVNCYYLLSYGLSLTIVAISLVINPNTYTQNDFCVLMEANALFYSSFVAPVLLFFTAALCYTFLSWVILCRKSHTTLKNKEHTRLANVRFDVRCSFIFLILLSSVWISAYYYLRLAKMEDEMSIVCGYLFISFNTLMGLYIFVFHCIQNEKIRREYRKYVRQNSWLPKCLRCSKASISSGIVGNSGIGGGGGVGTGNGGSGAGGTLTGNHRGNTNTAQLKKNKLPISGEDGLVSDDTGVIISAADDAIIATSDCELNDTRNLPSPGDVKGGGGDTIKTGTGNMAMQHGKSGGHSIIDAVQGHIVLERGGNGSALHSVGSSGGLRTPSAGHTSPTSSAGSTHLIFGGHQKQQQLIGGGNGGAPQESYYHQPDYYGWKQQQMGKSPGVGNNATSLAHPREYMGTNAVSPQQAHEFFYWTQKHQPHGKKKRGSGIGGESPSGSLHGRTTAASQQILFYPSYKKTTLKQQQQQYPNYDDAVGVAAYYQQQQHHHQQQHRRHASAAMMLAAHHQQQQQQLSSDEEHLEPTAAAHAHLLHLGRRAGSQLPPPPAPAPHHAYHYPHNHSPEFMGATAHTPSQRYYRNKHSNCDLSHEEYDPSGRAGSEQYYNQSSMGGGSGDGPVYEEILSNRNSDVQHYDMDLNVYRDNGDEEGVDAINGCDDDDDERGSAMRRQQQRQQQLRQRHHYEAARNGGVGSGSTSRYSHAESGASSEEDEDDDDDDEDDTGAQRRGLPQGDERMRRLIAMQDEEFQRRFQRQRKKGDTVLNDKTTAYFGHHNVSTPSSGAGGSTGVGTGATVFGISGGGSGSAGSIRAMKKISPSNRIGVHELFTTTHGGGGGGGGGNGGPPLPPANQQYPLPKRQQLSPTTATATATTPSSSHTKPIIGRNISAMLDENNTVRCYLEPLPK